ncbi:DinB family protein [Oceaniserpentilla sp. 4NH20-0058]|uniref:DinB family protein n=1 Tax=Oceaniserpentilla sp. 4NH20-0058 TaxID=3127660 RepID=UPI00310A955B
MNCLQHFRTLAKYNARMNQQVISAASQLSHEQLMEDRGAFFKSILGTLNHILVGDLIWLRRFAAYPRQESKFKHLNTLSDFPEISGLGQIIYPDFDEYKTARLSLDVIITNWINEELTETDLDSTFTYQNMKDESHDKNFGEVLSHLFNHQTHHRGQVSTLLSQQGIDIGVTDYLVDIKQLIAL